MPPKFDQCVKNGGRVRTLSNKHLICYPKGGGKPVTGEQRKDMKANEAVRVRLRLNTISIPEPERRRLALEYVGGEEE